MEKSKRNYGLSYLKVIATFFVIGLHMFGIGGLILNVVNQRKTYFALNIIYTVFFICINVFAITSGMLLYKRKEKNYNKVIDLISITIFYSFLITFIFYLFNIRDIANVPINKNEFLTYIFHGSTNAMYNINLYISSLFPLIFQKYWYVTSYLFLFLLIPYINMFIESIDRENYKKLLLLLFILLSVLPTLFFGVDLFKISSGYSPFWLIYCYLIGAYIGKYNIQFKSNKREFLYFSFITIASSSINYLLNTKSFKLGLSPYVSVRFIDYISPTNLFLSVIAVIIFSNLHLSSKNKIHRFIDYVSTTSFVIYIIHVHPLIYNLILKDIIAFAVSYNIFMKIIILTTYMLLIFFICFFAEILRRTLKKILKQILIKAKK